MSHTDPDLNDRMDGLSKEISEVRRRLAALESKLYGDKRSGGMVEALKSLLDEEQRERILGERAKPVDPTPGDTGD